MLKYQYKKAKEKIILISDNFKYYFDRLFNKEDIFKSVEKYCMFIGYPRSGHSLVGSLLDAHPNIIIGHELHSLKLFKQGVNPQKIYYLLLQNSKRKARHGRQETGYSYALPNQWQGNFETLKIIGDKKGSGTSRIVGDSPEILTTLFNKLDVPVKFIHVTRNPYDNISTIVSMAYLNKPDLTYGINTYFTKCEAVAYLKKQISKSDILDIRHESLIDNPKTVLSQLCNFLEVEINNNYLNDCASIVFKSPKKSRLKYEWSDELIKRVKNQIDKYEFLQGYSYED